MPILRADQLSPALSFAKSICGAPQRDTQRSLRQGQAQSAHNKRLFAVAHVVHITVPAYPPTRNNLTHSVARQHVKCDIDQKTYIT